MEQLANVSNMFNVFNMFNMFKELTKHGRPTHGVGTTPRILGADIDALVDHAVHIINSIEVSARDELSLATLNFGVQPYSWLIMRIRTWRNPAMTDRKSVAYLFKQIAKHIDMVYNVSITSRGFRFTEDDRTLYIAVVEDYRRLLKDVYESK
jgi:hypothetical protein